MLRPRAGQRIDQLYSPQDRQIKPLPRFGEPKLTPPGERYPERKARLEREAAELRSEISKIARGYLVASKRSGKGRAVDFAKANDRVLRTLIRQPYRDHTSLNVWFRNLRQEADMLARAEGLGIDSRSAMIDNFDEKVQRSIEQLIPFIEAVRRDFPEDILATGIELDVERGVDLLRAQPVWDQANQRLAVNIGLYQAKSGAVSEAGLSDLANQYLDKARSVQREREMDPEWFNSRGREVAAPQKLSVDELLSILTNSNSQLNEGASLGALGQYRRRADQVVQLNAMAQELDVGPVLVPGIDLQQIDFRLLVRNLQGQNIDISLEQALSRAA